MYTCMLWGFDLSLILNGDSDNYAAPQNWDYMLRASCTLQKTLNLEVKLIQTAAQVHTSLRW